ncbi:MAG: type IV toxin-antitoxin system AbiEi family antitoxin domain-containing protein, partial [Petrotogales bacterium]
GYARKMLFSLNKKGALYRIAKGCYIVIPPDMIANPSKFINDPYLVIDQLMEIFDEKYYVGYQSAAQLHGIAEQMPLSVSVVVLNQRRPLHFGNQRIGFRKVSKAKFFGVERIKYSGSFLNISDKEKTIIDCLERYDLCGGIDEVARMISNALENINGKKLLEYLKRFGNQPLLQRMGFILDRLLQNGFDIDKELLKDMEKLVGRRAYYLDPKMKGNGRYSKRWKIFENVDPISWLHV